MEADLRSVQALFNEEFDRLARTGAEVPRRMLALVAEVGPDADS